MAGKNDAADPRETMYGETVDEVAWAFSTLTVALAEEDDPPDAGAVLAAAERIVTGRRVADFVTAAAKPESKPKRGRKSRDDDGEEMFDDDDDDKPKKKRGGRKAGRRAKSGGGRDRKPRSQSAYCDCGDDCWQDFDENFDGCDCDPDECRREYRGKDAGPCGCIKPEPLMGGEVVMVEDRNGNWRWEEETD